MRPQVKETARSVGEVSKEIGRLWSEMEDKSKWEQLAEAGKVQYEEDKVKWKDECNRLMGGGGSLTNKADTTENKSKPDPKRDSLITLPPAPKRPLSAYFHFMAEMRPQVKETARSVGEVSKEIGRLWSEMEDKSKWEQLAEAGKVQYEEDKVKWKDECNRLMGGGGSLTSKPKTTDGKLKQDPKTNTGAKTNSTSRSNATKSTKRAPSAYMLFCSDNRLEIVEELMVASGGTKPGLGTVTKELAKKWSECKDETRLKYTEMAAEEKLKLLKTSETA